MASFTTKIIPKFIFVCLLTTPILAQQVECDARNFDTEANPPKYPLVPNPPSSYNLTTSYGATFNLTYFGCYVYRRNSATGRDANLFLDSEGPYSTQAGYLYEQCPDVCAYDGFRYFGLSNGGLCHCSMDVDLAEVSTSCNSTCPHYDYRTCGGTGAAGVWKIQANYPPKFKPKSAKIENPRREWFRWWF